MNSPYLSAAGCSLLLLCIITSACHTPRHNPNIRLQLKDSLTLEMQAADSLKQAGFYIASYENHTCLFIWSPKHQRLFAYPTSGPEKGKRIFFPALDTLLQRCDIRHDLCLYRTDSLWGLSNDKRRLYLFNLKGQLLQAWPVNNSFNGMPDIFFGGGASYWMYYYDPKRRRLYFNCDIAATPDQPFYQWLRVLALQITADSTHIHSLGGAFADNYKNKYYGISGSAASMAFFRDRIVISYYLSDSLHYFHPDSLQQERTVDAHSENFEPPTDFFDPAQDDNKEYTRAFSIAHASYGTLFYHSAASSYLFRVAEPPYHLYNDDSTINQPADKPWSLLVIDSNLQLLGEVHLPVGKLHQMFVVPDGKGFWIASLHDFRHFYRYEMVFD